MAAPAIPPSAPFRLTQPVADAATAAGVVFADGLARRAARRLMQVGTRTGLFGLGSNSNGTDTQVNSATIHHIAAAASGLRFGWGGFWQNTGSPAAAIEGTESMPISVLRSSATASFAQAGPTRTFFGGQTQTTVQPDALVLSDPMPRHYPVGSWAKANVYVEGASAGVRHQARAALGAIGERSESGTALTDKSLGGSIPSGLGFSYAPLLVLGIPDNPNARAVALIGNSITDGGAGGEAPEATYGFIGWPEKSLGMANPSGKFSRSGNYLTSWDARYRRMLAICQYFTDVHIELGTNDLYNTGGAPLLTLEQLQAKMTDLANEFIACGLGVMISTILPITATTSGSTGWTATDGSDQQVSAAIEAIRLPFNAWLLAGGIPGTRVSDAAGAATMPGTTGKWRAGWTGDGVHPNTIGAAAIAAAVNLADKFKYAAFGSIPGTL